MFTALASLLMRRPVRHDLAMTGEITLRGLVLPIGGLKEKTLAAQRAGIRHVIVPKRNEKDMPDIPEEVTKGLAWHFVENVDEVLEVALGAAATEMANGAPARRKPEKPLKPMAKTGRPKHNRGRSSGPGKGKRGVKAAPPAKARSRR